MTTINALIRTHRIALTDEGALAVYNLKTEAEKTEVIAAKEEIKAELRNRLAEVQKAREAKATEKEAIINSEKKITVYWQQGSPLSGYAPEGELASDILKDLGVAHDVSGWGTIVDAQMVKALGTEFLVSDVVEYLKPVTNAAEAVETAWTREVKAKTEEAKKTGKKALLRRWPGPCNDPGEECDLDMISEYVMPDGSRATTRAHTW